jgi:hypothetical protein
MINTMNEAHSPNKDIATSKKSLGQLILIVVFKSPGNDSDS